MHCQQSTAQLKRPNENLQNELAKKIKHSPKISVLHMQLLKLTLRRLVFDLMAPKGVGRRLLLKTDGEPLDGRGGAGGCDGEAFVGL